MGLYDRDYERERDIYDDSPGFRPASSLSWTNRLLIVMGAVYLVQLMTQPAGGRPGDGGWFTEMFSLYADLPRHPWTVYQLLTYGFLHDPGDIRHILFNGFALWAFGNFVEQHLGSREFLVFFLAAVAFSGACWVVSEFVAFRQLLPISLLGASGGIAAVLIYFCLRFPRQTIYLGFLIPIPAWIFALYFVGHDLIFAIMRSPQNNVAFTAHLGGVLFGGIYFAAGQKIGGWLSNFRMPKLGRHPPLRVHAPSEDEEDTTETAVDDILRKIREHGQDSLTRKERRILEEASREYQKRRK